VPLHETLLVVVGRGASDPDANSNVAKVARMLWEGFGFGWAETAYSGVTFPLVEPALEKAARLGFRRIVVFPYFLFTGILVQRIYDATDTVATRHPSIEFVKAPYLNDHPLVLDTFADRIREILDGENRMNCQLCKYREQILGFEAEVGLPQESHHHHVEGIGTGGARTFSQREKVAPRKPDEELQRRRAGKDADAASPHPPAFAGTLSLWERGNSGAAPTVLSYQPVHTHAHGHGHTHAHPHAHDHGDPHDHHHPPYPHADHPLGPRSLKKE
jgi:sirohydrochlorin cobaltochelatase